MKKSKKQQGRLIQLFPIIGVVLGCIAVLMMFLPAISMEGTKVTYTAWQTAFGYTEETFLSAITYFNFSLILFIGSIIAVAAIVFALYHYLSPKGNLFALLAVLCFVLSALCFFFQVYLASIGDGFMFGGIFGEFLNANDVRKNMQLGVGAIIGGIVSLLGAMVCLLPIFIKE